MNPNKLVRIGFNKKAVVNIDIESYQKHRHVVSQSRELQQTISDVTNMKQEMSDIKSMLTTLINGMNKNG